VVAESGTYRVEVIVFRNLSNTPEFSVVDRLRSFSQFPDVMDTGQTANEAAEPVAGQDGLAGATVFEALRADLPDDVRIVNQKSNAMEDVWRRLRSGREYQPLVYAAWEQNQVDYYPPMRIHNQQVIATELRAPTMIMVADLVAEDPLGTYRSKFYQLDGSLQLRRSRFLHLYLDLEIRQQRAMLNYDEGSLGESGSPATEETGGAGINKTGNEVYALKQNRQISTGEMQYFDTPGFGTLVYVTSNP
jgi:hypothetical protein